MRRVNGLTCIDDSGAWCGVVQGAGAQALQIVAAIAFARRAGLTYVHTPFVNVGHATLPQADYSRAWEVRFNLGLGERQARPGERLLNFGWLWQLDMVSLYHGSDSASFDDEIVAGLRAKYHAAAGQRENGPFVVAVHVRRGDVDQVDWPELWSPIEYFTTVLAQAAATLKEQGIPFEVKVFSQENFESAALFQNLNAHCFVNADPIWTFAELVESDMLITSISCFSQMAALISEGIVLTRDTGLAQRDWILCDESGRFKHDSLRARLAARQAVS